ncbi:AAA family ATPase [Aeromonas hydrophila]|uniref:AAA family ATPase n=1 Tax=Aeromonas hydrophila TaxID=644 RepID=UPI00214D2878|nr:AAA family ATPase [Aeromonas hydrophila]MCR3902508.1 AAA family ATPase [Aeromonas hydrophila]
MEFQVISRKSWVPSNGRDTVYLKIDNWNDYSFVTMFHMSYYDHSGVLYDIGDVKIAFKGQSIEVETHSKLPKKFSFLSDEFFSLGENVDFYKKISSLQNSVGINILNAIRDIVVQQNIIDDILDEDVFRVSLLRSASLSMIKGQYSRILENKPELTNFKFRFIRDDIELQEKTSLDFEVQVGATPSTNIHAIIGRNGVGKTTLLNAMIDAITDRENSTSKFMDMEQWGESRISSDYFSSLVSVSFSAFDPFPPPKEQPDPTKGTCYFYIGLKDPNDHNRSLTIRDLQKGCVDALISCFYKSPKYDLWKKSIEKLGSDDNFSNMKLDILHDIYVDMHRRLSNHKKQGNEYFKEKYFDAITPYLSKMSSGHAIVLLTITKLVATVEEKTIVLLDEPESHLHPPLLSAFIRTLSDLLYDRNGLAIIATHSPVVLQEIPRSCVWKVYRVGSSISFNRPDIETFAENVGILTSEVFNLEVELSGFHDILARAVSSGKNYTDIISDFDDNIGFEGRAILKALIVNRDRSSTDD